VDYIITSYYDKYNKFGTGKYQILCHYIRFFVYKILFATTGEASKTRQIHLFVRPRTVKLGIVFFLHYLPLSLKNFTSPGINILF
jgi:hypothetical protein